MEFKTQLNQLRTAYRNSGGIGQPRLIRLDRMSEFYEKNGFPEELTKLEMSLVPFVFMEANYDGINWTDQSEDLGHLKITFNLDCMFQNQGKRRQELSKEQFDRYVKFCFSAIDNCKKETTNPNKI